MMDRTSWLDAAGGELPPVPLWDDGERRYCRLWRQGADGGQHAFLVAYPSAEAPTAASIGRLVHEHALREHLQSGWALRPIELVRERGHTLLIFEHQDGIPLDQLIAPRLEIGRFLRIATAVGRALAASHERGLIHKDIKPSNILIDIAHDRAWLTGFGVASRLPRERQPPEPPEFIAGTLAYMAPEQTGRMNHSIDSRSDLYSLGVTLYEALTGRLPFTATHPMEWVHCHVARKPVPVSERVGGVPMQLSAIVMKLLEKVPEERYQTATGVTRDLQRCLAAWDSRQAIEEFPLGTHDTPERLLIPERLYGREHAVAALLASFDEMVASGTSRLVVVRGPPGIGKSSIVSELHRVLLPSRGLFASGKFGSLQSGVPYAALTEALRTLVRQLLSAPEAVLHKWRVELRQRLDDNSALLATLIPGLTILLGEQPAIPELSSTAAKARTQQALRQLIAAFAHPDHPLALFLDDLQWADAGTLDLLEDVLIQPDGQCLLLIGACRDDEAGDTRSLAPRLTTIARRGARVHEITLPSLAEDDLSQLIADGLACEKARAAPLAGLVHAKTAGNPFFATRFLHVLAEEGFLRFDHAAANWSWDLGHIEARGYTERVVDLIVGKLSRLPLATQETLRTLACLGHKSPTSALATACEMSEAEVHATLWEALRAELIVHPEDAYEFVHDRVREAAYAQIPEDGRAHAHLQIGRRLVRHLSRDGTEDAVFTIATQLNRGMALMTSREEREELAALNLAAGKRSRAAGAPHAALAYLTAGSALIDEERGAHRHDIVFGIGLHLAECEFLTGHVAAAEARLVALSVRARSTVERAAVTCVLADIYVALQRVDRSVATCLAYLSQEGLEISMQPSDAQAQAAYERLWTRIGGRAIEEFAELPLMLDPAARATLDVLAKISRSALTQMDLNLLSVVLCAAVELCLQQGNCDSACYAYEYFGVVAAWRFGDFDASVRFGRLGYDLVERHGLRQFDALVCLTFANRILSWTTHVRRCEDLIHTAFDRANRSGDRISAVSSRCVLVSNRLLAGDSLSDVQRVADAGLAYCRETRFRDFIDAAEVQAALIRNLRGLTRRFGSLDDDRFDETQLQERFASQPHVPVFECWYWIRRLQARFLAGDYEAALEAARRARALLFSTVALVEIAEYELFSALTHAAACDSVSPSQRQTYLATIVAHHGRLDLWARHCPENFASRTLLVAAEIARLEGRHLDAMELYESAMRSAHENGFVHVEAFSGELAARFYSDCGFDRIARAYLRDARDAYVRWGADGKARQLEERHPYLREAEPPPAAARTVQTAVEHLDLGTVLKVLQAVAGETEVEKLVATIMHLGLEHAGAVRGLLIVPNGDGFRIEAVAKVVGDAVKVALGQADTNGQELPESVLHYVLRTKEIVLLHDALGERPFSEDAYVRQHRPRSVLCMPLLAQTRLVGLLYLENDLAAGVFTPARIAVLKLLGSVAAISLESSRLQHDLQEREAKVRRLVDSSIIGIFVWRADGRILDTNDAFLGIVGYDRDELLSGRVRWTDLIPSDLRDRTAQTLTELWEVRTVHAQEREYVRKDGIRVPVLVAGAVFDGSPSEGVAFVLDLTERKRAEEAQRASEREARLIVDSIPGLVALLSATGEVEVVNRQLSHYFGQTLDELRQWGTNETVHAEDRAHVIEVFSRSLASGAPYDIVQRFRRFDGVYRWFRNSGYPLHDAEGRIVRWCVLLTDIDEQKRAQDALRQSERNARLIVDSIPGMICVLSADGDLEFMNRQGLEYFGVAVEDLQLWRTGGLTHPEDLARSVDHFTRSIAEGVPWEVEARGLRFDGVYRWTQTRGAPLRDAEGRIARWYNVIIDIDERKRAEEALAASERNLKLIIDTMPALAWSTTPDGAADFFNRHYLEYAGISAEQASGWGWTAAVHPDDIDALADTWRRCLRDGVPGEAEARMRRHDGEYRWFLMRTSALRDAAGRIIKWYGVNTDIEDRKRIEAELRRTYTSLSEAQRLSRCGSFFSNFATQERIWSDELYRILELDPATQVTGHLFRSMVHTEDLPVYDAQFARLMAGQNLETGFRVVTAKGAVKFLRSICQIVDWNDGRPVCFGAVQDVTETVVAQEALDRARSDLAHVARVSTLGALTASIAHEVNQPLSGIMTNASTCLRMLDADPPNLDGARETARRTIRDGHRASDVITRLRVLFSRRQFTLEPLDLNEAVGEVVALYQSDLQRQRVVLQLELAEELPRVMGDRIQLQQVVLNLLVNGTEAMSEVEGRSRILTIGSRREGADRVRVTVRDTGTGVDPASVDRLFDAFYSTKQGGMGIGLSVSRSIVERHDGRLWIEPSDEPGTTVAFSLPCPLQTVIDATSGGTPA